MWKKMLPLIGILILALGLTACQAASATTTAPEAQSPGQMQGHGRGAGQGNGMRGQGKGGQMQGGVHDEHVPGEAHPMMTIPTPSDTHLTDAEKADLLHMREEEKLARDVYLTLYDKWGMPVFSNIARSEQMHMDAIGTLLANYGLDDPVAQTNDQRGVFANSALQDLYNQLVEQGSASLTDALTVGATIEDLDIKDLDDAIARTTHTDIQSVYNLLRNGSYHHMQAFVGTLRAKGGEYTPQFISQEAFDKIMSGTMNGMMGKGSHGDCQEMPTPSP